MEPIAQNEDIERIVEILKDQLYFVVINGGTNKKLKNTQDTHFFTIDEELVYQNYYNDFGPLNISCVYKYCCKMNKCLRCCRGYKQIVHYTSHIVEKKTNAACLMGLYAILYLRLHPKTVCKLLYAARPFKSYVDASQFPFPYEIRLVDVFHAMAKALTYNLVNFVDFNDVEYDMYNKLQYGDMNWLLPRKFLAFIGPTATGELSSHPPNFYVKYFLKNDVKTVIRLNNKMYDERVFQQNGIEHYDLVFPDGTSPSKEILMRFLQLAENLPMASAVHCKAGLGRTGSLIAAYIVKHFHFTAKEAIAWLRLCRPGSVIGQQQVWLERIEHWLWRSGKQFRMKQYGDGDKIPCFKFGIYSKMWPVERDKLIQEARKKIKRKVRQNSISNSSNNQNSICTESKGSEDEKKAISRFHRFKKRALNDQKQFKQITKILSSVHGFGSSDDGSALSKITFLKAEPQQDQDSVATRTFEDKATKTDKPRSAGYHNELFRKVGHMKGCVHKAVQGDNLYGLNFIDNQQTCIEKYGQKYLNKHSIYNAENTKKWITNVGNKSRNLSAKRNLIEGNVALKKIPIDQGFQGDRLMYIKANNMYKEY